MAGEQIGGQCEVFKNAHEPLDLLDVPRLGCSVCAILGLRSRKEVRLRERSDSGLGVRAPDARYRQIRMGRRRRPLCLFDCRFLPCRRPRFGHCSNISWRPEPSDYGATCLAWCVARPVGCQRIRRTAAARNQLQETGATILVAAVGGKRTLR